MGQQSLGLLQEALEGDRAELQHRLEEANEKMSALQEELENTVISCVWQ